MACNAEYGTDRLGGDLLDSPLEDITQPGDCCQQCQKTPGINAVTVLAILIYFCLRLH